MRTGKMKQALAEYLQPPVAPLMLVLQARCRMQHVLYGNAQKRGEGQKGEGVQGWGWGWWDGDRRTIWISGLIEWLWY